MESNGRKEKAFQACWLTTGGLFLGFTFFYGFFTVWNAPHLITSVAYFVSKVLLSSLLSAMVCGLILGSVIYPLHYFVIQRLSRLMGAGFFLLGILSGVFLPIILINLEI